MEKRFLKQACLAILIMSSALQAMDADQPKPGFFAGLFSNPQKFIDYEKLESAVKKGDLQRVEELVRDGADVNATQGGWPILLDAIQFGSYKICEFLIARGAHVNPQSSSETAPLIMAAKTNLRDICELLIKYGAKINASNSMGFTGLIFAAKNGNEKICELLVENKADVDASDFMGDTALIHAANGNHKKICELLIAHGADVNAKNSNGQTALINAAREGDKDICKLLIANKADINLQSKKGNTALMLAAIYGYKDVCKLLINALIKPTKKEIDSVVALLGISKKKRSEQLNLAGRDVVKVIGRKQYNDFRRLHKPQAKMEIDKIDNEKVKQELLEYLNSI